jgi:preprotein translocase subunit SecA
MQLKTAVTKIFGSRFERELKRIQPLIDQIHEHETRLAQVSDAEIQA